MLFHSMNFWVKAREEVDDCGSFQEARVTSKMLAVKKVGEHQRRPQAVPSVAVYSVMQPTASFALLTIVL